MIKKSIKTKWVKALRSGQFRQAKGSLQAEANDDPSIQGFCCLGVLASIVDPKRDTWDANDGFFGGAEDDGDTPQCFVEQVKLLGGQLPKSYVNKLSTFNDGKNSVPSRSFKWIASWIERSKRI